jgi:putative lipoprotein
VSELDSGIQLAASLSRHAGIAGVWLIVACGLAACSGEGSPDQAQSATTALRSFAYNCASNGYIVADFRRGDAVMWLFMHDQTVQLDPVEAASGAKYRKGEITFWSKGSEAILEVAGATDSCTENRRASILEDAKLRGVSLRATGNEPGWVMEIGPDAIVLATNYGANRYRFPLTTPDEDQSNRITTYRSEADGKVLKLRLIGVRCQDTMSDDVFATSVEFELDEAAYRGCGQPLY